MWEDMMKQDVVKTNTNAVLEYFWYRPTIRTVSGVALTRSELETNISDVFAVELFQNLSGYRNSFYPHQNLMASLNGEHPSEARMI